jgi:hypothetical protein
MNVTLREEDAVVVDLLLDGSPVATTRADGNGGGPVFVPPADGVSGDRVRAAERVLGALNWLPAEEPPNDLVSRTVLRVEEFGRRHRVIVDPLVHSPHPHA